MKSPIGGYIYARRAEDDPGHALFGPHSKGFSSRHRPPPLQSRRWPGTNFEHLLAMPRRRRPALTLGDMRALGANSLQVFCTECGATRTLDVSKFPNSLTVSWFGGHLDCRECGQKASVRPLWSKLNQ